MTSLAVGDRVCILLAAEPDSLDFWKGLRLACGADVVGHRPEHQGRTGTIRECVSGGFPCGYGAEIGHDIVVMYDQPHAIEGERIAHGGHFAAGELELVA